MVLPFSSLRGRRSVLLSFHPYYLPPPQEGYLIELSMTQSNQAAHNSPPKRRRKSRTTEMKAGTEYHQRIEWTAPMYFLFCCAMNASDKHEEFKTQDSVRSKRAARQHEYTTGGACAPSTLKQPTTASERKVKQPSCYRTTCKPQQDS